nr:ribonuclease H-like domain-containing protein [Tanacetum cinerariifolium]
MKGIKREFSIARTPQQNGVAERKTRTLIEVARTMLVDSKLPTTFWVEVVDTACYVLNRALVIKPHNKTPYELIHGRPPLINFMKPFGCPITILNTKDSLGKFDEKLMRHFLPEDAAKNSVVDAAKKATEVDASRVSNNGRQDDQVTKNKWAIGTKWIFRNKKDERGIVVKNKARLVAHEHTQEEVYQMDGKSAFLYGKIEEEVCQPPGFEDPDFSDKVYKVEKALYRLHQALSVGSCTSERAEVYYECKEPFKSLKYLWVRSKSIVAIWLEGVVTPLIEPAIKGFAAASAVLKPKRLKVDKHDMSEPLSYYLID